MQNYASFILIKFFIKFAWRMPKMYMFFLRFWYEKQFKVGLEYIFLNWILSKFLVNIVEIKAS